MNSDPSKELIGKSVIVSNINGTVRGFDPHSLKWWVVTAGDWTYNIGWFAKSELTLV